MLDFKAVTEKRILFETLIENITQVDLLTLTNEMIDKMLQLIAACNDADVTFEPYDPEAYDDYAASDTEVGLSWTLGHVIVHTTATAEEAAAQAAELARGVFYEGRSRYELPWQTVTTIAQCRHRLEESRRMRLGSLSMWPDQPHLDMVIEPWPGAPRVNAIGRFILGLYHDYDHLEQIANIVRQSQSR